MDQQKRLLRGYSGLPKVFWFLPFTTLFSVVRMVINGVSDYSYGGYMNAGSSFALTGGGAVISAFVVRDWYLMWLDRKPAPRRLDTEGMHRDARHPDWVRAYQRKPRI